MHIYSGDLAGIHLTFDFRYAETARYYRDILSQTQQCMDCIVIPETDVLDLIHRWNISDPAYAEYVMSCSYACDHLMKSRRIVFHGVSVLWNESAYVFTATSGTGKTTQARLWVSVFPEKVEILNGDKPILNVETGENVIVCPSPWKGKEGYGRDDIIAPLKGIILLRQRNHNRIHRMSPAEASKYLFGRICSTYSTEEDVQSGARILEDILKIVPVWLLENKGDEESALMTRKALLEEES